MWHIYHNLKYSYHFNPVILYLGIYSANRLIYIQDDICISKVIHIVCNIKRLDADCPRKVTNGSMGKMESKETVFLPFPCTLGARVELLF